MARLRIVSHDRSLRGHVQRQVLFTPLLGVDSIKKGGWGKQYEKIRLRFHKWVYRMRTKWPTTETVMQMQLCYPPATMLTGRKFRSCKRTRFCPWCHARQMAQVLDLVCAVPVLADHVIVAFRNSRKLYARDGGLMSPELKKNCTKVLASWIGSFRASNFHQILPAYGAVVNHTLLCTTDYNIKAERNGIALVPKHQVDTWLAWQNGPKEFDSERRYVRAFEDATHASVAHAVVVAFKYPKRLFTITPDNLALVLRLQKRYRFLRTTGACYSNPGLKKKESTHG